MRIESVYYVNEYLCNREFGGPEEGGWWFDTGEFVDCKAMFTTLDEAEEYVGSAEVEEWLERMREDQRPTDSVLCAGWTDLFIELAPGAHFPSVRPHYE